MKLPTYSITRILNC